MFGGIEEDVVIECFDVLSKDGCIEYKTADFPDCDNIWYILILPQARIYFDEKRMRDEEADRIRRTEKRNAILSVLAIIIAAAGLIVSIAKP